MFIWNQFCETCWWTDFATNRNALEGYDKPDGELDESVNNLHNLVHAMLNGTSALSHSAANDPIFLVRLWSPRSSWNNKTVIIKLTIVNCHSHRCYTLSPTPFSMGGWRNSFRPTPPSRTRWPPLVTTGTTTWFPSSLPSPTRRFMWSLSSWGIPTPSTWKVRMRKDKTKYCQRSILIALR